MCESVLLNQKEENGETLYHDGECWMSARNTCQHCLEERAAVSMPFRWADERYSFGVYAGRWCDQCWPNSGYRDATDPDAAFDRADAGEAYWEDEY